MWSTSTAVSPTPTRRPSVHSQHPRGADIDCDSDTTIRSALAQVRLATPTDDESLERTIYQALAAQRAAAAATGQHLTPEDDWLTLLSAIAVHEHRHASETVASG